MAKQIPPAAVARLTIYLRALTTLLADGVDRVSSESLAEASGVSSSTLRKDLSYVGSYGTRGVGYEVQYLNRNIAAALGLTHDWKVAIVGAGNLARPWPGTADSSLEALTSWRFSTPTRWWWAVKWVAAGQRRRRP